MLAGYALANIKRSWYISDVQIWGDVGWGMFEFLLVENIDSTRTVLFDAVSIGDSSQVINFNDLIDCKGNRLPVTLENPKVFVKPKSEQGAFVVGEESSSGFKVSRNPGVNQPVKVDLYIIEIGD